MPSFLEDSLEARETTEMPAPPGLLEMFINSTDTLQKRRINQKISEEWNDRPPLFFVHVKQKRRLWGGPRDAEVSEDEDPSLLKGMIRQGIPPSLRCAVWLSNVIQAAHPHENLKLAHEYRTLAKVQVLDHAYNCLWEDHQINEHNSNSPNDNKHKLLATLKRKDVQPVSFGNIHIWEMVQGYEGKRSLADVLYALSHVLGPEVEYAPLIPAIAATLLGFMSESYVFCAIREMAKHTTWYWAATKPEHTAYTKAFQDILGRLHPHTVDTMIEKGVEEQFANIIFQDFFWGLLAEAHILRIMDIYSLEGTKALFRFGVSLAVLYQREWKEKYVYELETSWWDGLLDFCQSPSFPFDLLVRKAYGVHGKGVRKRFRFPRRPILARIIQLEEEKYWSEQTVSFQSGSSHDEHGDEDLRVTPLGLVPAVPPEDPAKELVAPKLAESTLVRQKLAEWLPLSLRFTNLELIYSTNHHGRTLENLYRHVRYSRRTIMLIEPISTKQDMVVGMFAPQTWHASTKVYGDGSCFLFRILDEKEESEAAATTTNCWKWCPKELDDLFEEDQPSEVALLEQFQVGTTTYISMGGNPDGTAGLRLNEDLTKGESSTAAGFANEPLAGKEFEVGLVEVYQMVRELDGKAVY